jgi:hypothetical protein
MLRESDLSNWCGKDLICLAIVRLKDIRGVSPEYGFSFPARVFPPPGFPRSNGRYERDRTDHRIDRRSGRGCP